MRKAAVVVTAMLAATFIVGGLWAFDAQTEPNVGDPVVLIVFWICAFGALALSAGLQFFPEVRWNYTKTVALLNVAHVVVRLPFMGGPSFWDNLAGAAIPIFLMTLPFGVIFDLASGLRSVLRNRSASGRPPRSLQRC